VKSPNEWKPSLKQTEFLSVPTTVKEAFYGGGAGSGKSELLLMFPLIHKWHTNHKFKQVFMRRTYPELRSEILPRSRDFYTKFGATLNKTEMTWTFPREDQYGGTGRSNEGAMIFLGHCENEDDARKYDTMEINLFTPDELTSYTEWIYLYIGFTRVRTSHPDLPAIIRAAGMPGGIGHSWVKKRFIDPAINGGKIIVGKGGNKRIFIFATQSDNPYIDPNYKTSLEALPEAEKKAKLYGDFNAYLGQVFTEFRDRRYLDEPPNAIHVIEPFDIPQWWPKIVIGDWGFAAMTWIGYAAISPSRRVFIYREQHWIKTKIAEWAPHVKLYIDRESPRLIRFCKSAGQDRGQEHTIQQQIEEEIGQPIELSNNTPGSRIAGKSLIHEYLRWQPKLIMSETERSNYNDDYAMWIMRNRGLNEYKSYLKSFEPQEPELNLPKLQIFNGACPILVEAIKACSYDKPKGNKPAEDVAEFEGDDPIDALRYLVDACEGFFDDANEEFKKIQKQEALIQKLSADNDWTAFYRNSQKLESESEESIKPVGRYRH
jgi:hypothetical protein